MLRRSAGNRLRLSGGDPVSAGAVPLDQLGDTQPAAPLAFRTRHVNRLPPPGDIVEFL
jgi:hypothetical protein